MTQSMRRVDGMAYAQEHGVRGLADLFLPRQVDGAPAALVIHGGGWNAMDKTAFTAVSELMASCGYAALSINYRLVDDAPWPACGDDCLAAAALYSLQQRRVVPIEQSRRMLAAYAAAGARGELAEFPGAGRQHGIWRPGADENDPAQRTLVPPVEQAIRRFLASLCDTDELACSSPR